MNLFMVAFTAAFGLILLGYVPIGWRRWKVSGVLIVGRGLSVRTKRAVVVWLMFFAVAGGVFLGIAASALANGSRT